MAERVPSEVWGEIFGYLPPCSTSSIARVCKRWHAVCSSEAFFMSRIRALPSYQSESSLPPLTTAIKFHTHVPQQEWTGKEPATFDQLMHACVSNSNGAPRVLSYAWGFFYPHPISVFLLTAYRLASCSSERSLVVSLACRLGVANAVDLFREQHALMQLLLSVALKQVVPCGAPQDQLRTLLQQAGSVRQHLEAEQRLINPNLNPNSNPNSNAQDVSVSSLNAFVELLAGKCSARLIAEQISVRSWYDCAKC